jgi:glycosyltransferase involved in cell wall biosynthesis
MRIIHITPSYKPAFIYGGTISAIAQLCEALTKSNQEVEVITTTANGKEELPFQTAKAHAIDGVSITHFNRYTKDHTHFSPSLLWHMLNTTKKNQKELIIHIHSWWNLTSLFSCLIAKYKNIPVILSPRGMLSPYTLSNRNKLFKALIHLLIGKTLVSYCKIHATSEKEHKDLLKIQNQANIAVIPNLVHFPPIVAVSVSAGNHTPGRDKFNLLFLSRIEEKKGLELLFKALRKADFRWQLTIAGTGQEAYLKKLKLLALELKICDSIIWKGHINDCDKYQVIAKNDLLVLFSYNENFANVIAESLTMGTPVAISKEVGLAPFILKHDLGWVSELNPEAIAVILNQAFQDTAKRKKINRVAPALIRAHFSSKGIIEQYLNLYKHSL